MDAAIDNPKGYYDGTEFLNTSEYAGTQLKIVGDPGVNDSLLTLADDDGQTVTLYHCELEQLLLGIGYKLEAIKKVTA